MLRERREAAQKVAESLFATEAAIDEALVKASMLVGSIPTARVDAKLSAVVGQDAIDKAAEAVAALVAARRAMVEAHDALYQVQGQIGLGAVSFGNFMKPSLSGANLRPVGSKAA